jgi:hypothetical protein
MQLAFILPANASIECQMCHDQCAKNLKVDLKVCNYMYPLKPAQLLACQDEAYNDSYNCHSNCDYMNECFNGGGSGGGGDFCLRNHDGHCIPKR